MSFAEAVALQPTWVVIWINILFLCVFVLPIFLLFWSETRQVAFYILVTSGLAAALIVGLYNQLGYVKLLGLPHLFFWVPLLGYLLRQYLRGDLPSWAGRILFVIMAAISVSLTFDIYDVVCYLSGQRLPVVGTR